MGATIQIAVLAQADAARRELNSVGDTAQGLGGRVKAGLGSLAGFAKAGVVGAGVAVGAMFVQAFGGVLEKSQLDAKLAAQLGLSKDEAAKAGKISGSVYAAGFGTDVAQVNEAIKGVYQNIGKGNEGWTKDITAQVLSVANVFEQDLGGTTAAVGQMLRTGLAKDATEALDIIAVGFQKGANKADDLLDTFNEYGTQFRKLGLSGKEATGILSQGLQAGARDADIVADALKEFSIRAIDGSKATGEAYKGLGLNAKQMAADVAGGGPKASKALDTVLDRLRAVKDPVERAQLAVKLFGTQAEDLGDALFAIDPSKAVGALGQVAGAAKGVGDAMADTAGAKIERFKRTLFTGFGEVVGKVLGWGEDLGKKLGPVWDDMATRIQPFITEIGQNLMPNLQAMWQVVQEKVVPALAGLGEKLLPKIQEIAGVIKDDVIPAFMGWVEAIAPIYQWIAEKLWPVVVTVFTQIANVIGGALKVISGIVNVFAGLITGDWSRMWEGIKQIVSGAWAVIKGLFSGAWAVIKGVFSAGVEGLVNIAKTINTRILGAVIGFGGLLLGWATAAWNAAKAAFTSGISAVVSFSAGLPGRVRAAISTLGGLIFGVANSAWSSAKSAFASGVSAAVSTAAGLPGRVRSGLGSLGSYLYSAGQDLIRGLINGIKNMAGAAVNAARGVVGDAVSGAKRLLGINSPSKVFIEIGEQTGTGFVLGLEGQQKAAQRAAGRLLDIPSAATVAAGSIDLTRPVGGSQQPMVSLSFDSGGDPLMDVIWEQLRKRVRVSGGSVQTALGR